MKIYEIISEAPEYTTPGGIVIPSGAKTAAPISKPTTAPSGPAGKAIDLTTKSGVADRAKTIGRRYDSVKGGALAKLLAHIQKKKKISAGWDEFKKTSNANSTKQFLKFQQRAGKVISWGMRALGLIVIVTEYYNVTGQLEELYQNDEIDDAIFKEYIGQCNGILTTQLIAWYAQIKLSSKLAFVLFRIVRWVAGGLSAGATLGASIATIVASEAFFVWFERFLNSPSGQDWLINGYFGPLITNVGYVQGAAWNLLFGYYDKQAVNKADKKAKDTGKEPETPVPADTPEKRAARGGKELTPAEIEAQKQAVRKSAGASTKSDAAVDKRFKELGLD